MGVRQAATRHLDGEYRKWRYATRFALQTHSVIRTTHERQVEGHGDTKSTFEFPEHLTQRKSSAQDTDIREKIAIYS